MKKIVYSLFLTFVLSSSVYSEGFFWEKVVFLSDTNNGIHLAITEFTQKNLSAISTDLKHNLLKVKSYEELSKSPEILTLLTKMLDSKDIVDKISTVKLLAEIYLLNNNCFKALELYYSLLQNKSGFSEREIFLIEKDIKLLVARANSTNFFPGNIELNFESKDLSKVEWIKVMVSGFDGFDSGLAIKGDSYKKAKDEMVLSSKLNISEEMSEFSLVNINANHLYNITILYVLNGSVSPQVKSFDGLRFSDGNTLKLKIVLD